ncbi:hypothetical protein BGZ65_007631 [Modicella reniformis]|uniref:protein S-acyltransferase n=1 Tax=Modicella reniformis TaxID=1440133 RepID=A0A9P6SSB2_9FUNG|nr:hypothetical protein BGZ65_007631 [Modicella reniformis]
MDGYHLVSLVKFALDNGQPIDSVLNGVYPIHAACCSNANVAVVLFLLEKGADVNARRLARKYSSEKGVQTVGTTGSTPLHFAAANGCLAVVDILLRHGAIVDKADKYGSTPLSVSAARNHPDVASLLRQYSAMQRGVQDLTPDKDPIIDRRSSSDYGFRGSPAVTPPLRSPTKETTPQSPLAQSGRSVQTTRSPGQRRISMPSITESPSSSNILTPPRQSCDLGRTPQSTEPLIRSTGSLRLTPAPPTRNVTLLPFVPKALPTRDLSDPTMNKSKSHGGGRGMRRSHTTQGAKANYLTTPPKMKRRKSMESAAFLSPQSAMTIQRRKSFDQLSSLTKSKSRRSSDASTVSQGTVSSRTSGTSHTSMSDHVADSGRERVSNHGINGGSSSSSSSNNNNNNNNNNTFSNTSTRTTINTIGGGANNNNNNIASAINGNDQGDNHDAAAAHGAKSIESDSSSAHSGSLPRSFSQSIFDQIKPRRKPMPFAMDSAIRQSLDLQRLLSNQERTANKAKNNNTEPRNESDSDLPGVLSRHDNRFKYVAAGYCIASKQYWIHVFRTFCFRIVLRKCNHIRTIFENVVVVDNE